jgi:hypothetical protein
MILTRFCKHILSIFFDKIRESNTTPTNNKENRLRLESERSYKTLSQEIAKLRSSRTNLLTQSPLETKQLTPKQSSKDIKILSGFLSDNFRESEREKSATNRFNQTGTSTAYESSSVKDDTGSKKLGDQLPLSKIYEIQDIFYNITDKEFNELSSE